LLGPHDALGDGAFVGQKRARDLRRVEAVGDAQRERDLRGARQRWMAAQEDEAELVVEARHRGRRVAIVLIR
jgi:hypothetical protein